MMHRIPRWLAISAAVAAATLLCVLFVDKPLALAFGRLGVYRAINHNQTVHLPVLVAGACLTVLLGAVSIAWGKPLSRRRTCAMLAGLALLWSYSLIEFVLKPIFGRTLPMSLVDSGLFGFWPFQVGGDYGSFPSGHSDQASAILAVLWIQYPAWRWIYVAAFAALALALMIGEWHFLGDIIAGGAIGAAAGAWTVRLWEMVRQQRSEMS